MMKIAVAIKWVADLDSIDVDALSGAVDRSRLLYVLDPGAESALAVALQLGAEVTAYSVGGPEADAALRIALAAGASTVARLDAEARPALTASLLAQVIGGDGPFDLVLLGTRSFDRGSGEVPARLAEGLGWPVVTDVVSLALNESGVELERELDGGTKEIVRVAGPAVIGLGPDVARLAPASLPNLMKSQRAAIAVRAVATTTLPTDPVILERIELPLRPRVRPVKPPQGSPDERLASITQGAQGSRARGRILEGPPGEMADAIMAFLRERGFLEDLRG